MTYISTNSSHTLFMLSADNVKVQCCASMLVKIGPNEYKLGVISGLYSVYYSIWIVFEPMMSAVQMIILWLEHLHCMFFFVQLWYVHQSQLGIFKCRSDNL